MNAPCQNARERAQKAMGHNPTIKKRMIYRGKRVALMSLETRIDSIPFSCIISDQSMHSVLHMS